MSMSFPEIVEYLHPINHHGSRWSDAPRNKVYHADAESVLWRLPANSVDVFWFSPPYNLADKFRGGNSVETKVRRQYDLQITKTGDGLLLQENVYQAQQSLVLALCNESLKKNGVCFYSHKVRIKDGVSVNPRKWIENSGFFIIQEIIWDRGSTAQGDPRRFYPVYETIYVLAKKPAIKSFHGDAFRLHNPGKSSGGFGYTDVWRINSGENRSVTGHPCATPDEIVARCLDAVINLKGQLVCDPYCGTGTTGRLARDRGCDILMADADKKWAKNTLMALKGVENGGDEVRNVSNEESGDNRRSGTEGKHRAWEILQDMQRMSAANEETLRES